ncbi:MAG: hypothetical protein FIO02_06880 [Nitrosopumilales archaeon]|nr:hypothetical protein [Thermoproteota archaeon]MRN40748.1 hypothetical protein [Nitrosopumilales archaeon]MRN61308.1 hypothetical protein [Nitrosopumilales archaeon]
MFTRKNAVKDDEKQRQVERFYILLRTLMDELFEYAPKSGHVKMPFNVSFGLIHDQRDSILLSGIEQKTGKKMYLYNVRIIGQMFEDKREQMIADKTADTLFSWIGDVCSLYVRPFVYDYVVNTQHRGKGAADRTTRQIVRGFLNKLVNDPELKYVLNTIKG